MAATISTPNSTNILSESKKALWAFRAEVAERVKDKWYGDRKIVRVVGILDHANNRLSDRNIYWMVLERYLELGGKAKLLFQRGIWQTVQHPTGSLSFEGGVRPRRPGLLGCCGVKNMVIRHKMIGVRHALSPRSAVTKKKKGTRIGESFCVTASLREVLQPIMF